jgi:hypothetical protein
MWNRATPSPIYFGPRPAYLIFVVYCEPMVMKLAGYNNKKDNRAEREFPARAGKEG